MQSISTTLCCSVKIRVGLTQEEQDELRALREVISYLPSSVHPRKMERFTELLIRANALEPA